jgi:hypothetical protein
MDGKNLAEISWRIPIATGQQWTALHLTAVSNE